MENKSHLSKDIAGELRSGLPENEELADILAGRDLERPMASVTVAPTAATHVINQNPVFEIALAPIDTEKVKAAFYATEKTSKERFVVGYEVPYNGMRGLSQTYVPRLIPSLKYDRGVSEKTHGLWAQFIWPTVVGESGGHHLRINTYDRARFTFGFYQLAAHTPNDNLILLFRELLKLPLATAYFPDLVLSNSVVCQVTPAEPKSLEREERVQIGVDKYEVQIPDFMAYLNPTSAKVEDAELQNAAKLMHWMMHDPAALETGVRTAFGIMRGKIAKIAVACGLVGQEPELAVWASDIRHQGRGSIDRITAAVRSGSLDDKREALFAIDHENGSNFPRRNTIRDCLRQLVQVEKRFDGIKFGSGPLAL